MDRGPTTSFHTNSADVILGRIIDPDVCGDPPATYATLFRNIVGTNCSEPQQTQIWLICDTKPFVALRTRQKTFLVGLLRNARARDPTQRTQHARKVLLEQVARKCKKREIWWIGVQQQVFIQTRLMSSLVGLLIRMCADIPPQHMQHYLEILLVPVAEKNNKRKFDRFVTPKHLLL